MSQGSPGLNEQTAADRAGGGADALGKVRRGWRRWAQSGAAGAARRRLAGARHSYAAKDRHRARRQAQEGHHSLGWPAALPAQRLGSRDQCTAGATGTQTSLLAGRSMGPSKTSWAHHKVGVPPLLGQPVQGLPRAAAAGGGKEVDRGATGMSSSRCRRAHAWDHTRRGAGTAGLPGFWHPLGADRQTADGGRVDEAGCRRQGRRSRVVGHVWQDAAREEKHPAPGRGWGGTGLAFSGMHTDCRPRGPGRSAKGP